MRLGVVVGVGFAGWVAWTLVAEQLRRRALRLRLQPTSPSGSVFISYSRSELPLVEDLVEALDERGVPTFVDFRNLVPGQAWADQLDEALRAAALVVLVVSERSVWTSINARAEWQRALADHRRVVLAVAEPAALPDELRSLEWIDLRRGRFSTRVDELVGRLERPETPAVPPPTGGLRPPAIVWAGVATAVPVALLSVLFVVPAVVLLPLPLRILRRSFTYPTTRLALIGLLLATAMVGLPVPPFPLLAIAVLRSRSFRRWMQPAASRPRYPALPTSVPSPTASPQRVWIDSAPQDACYVNEFVDELRARGHQTAPVPRATAQGLPPLPITDGVILRFVSTFNDRVDLESTVTTLPILLSEPDDELPRRLQSTQWIDLRHGGRRRRRREVRHLAASIDRPDELLKRIGVAPPHNTRLLPRGVRARHDFLVLLAIGVVAGAVTAGSIGSHDSGWTWLRLVGWTMGVTVLCAHCAWVLSRRLPARRFGLRMFALWWGTVAAGNAMSAVTSHARDEGRFTDLADVVVLYPLIAIPLVVALTHTEVRYWLPPRDALRRGRS